MVKMVLDSGCSTCFARPQPGKHLASVRRALRTCITVYRTTRRLWPHSDPASKKTRQTTQARSPRNLCRPLPKHSARPGKRRLSPPSPFHRDHATQNLRRFHGRVKLPLAVSLQHGPLFLEHNHSVQSEAGTGARQHHISLRQRGKFKGRRLQRHGVAGPDPREHAGAVGPQFCTVAAGQKGQKKFFFELARVHRRFS